MLDAFNLPSYIIGSNLGSYQWLVVWLAKTDKESDEYEPYSYILCNSFKKLNLFLYHSYVHGQLKNRSFHSSYMLLYKSCGMHV